MSEIKKGSTVSLHYTGTLDDGTEFDSSLEREPLTFVVGEGNLIPGLENAVIGMNEGDTKVVSIPPEEAYGGHNQEMVVQAPVAELPEDVQVGMVLQTEMQGRAVYFRVTDLGEELATLDCNHPLADKTLNFDIKIVGVE